MNVRDLAQRAVILDELAERVEAARYEVRSAVAQSMAAGDRLAVTSPGGVELASVTLARGRVSARIVDVQAFTDWVVQHYPEETRTEVREAFRRAVLQASKTAGQPCAPDGTLDVPGVVVTTGEPIVQVRRSDGASTELDRMWTAGEINLRGLLELPGGGHA